MNIEGLGKLVEMNENIIILSNTLEVPSRYRLNCVLSNSYGEVLNPQNVTMYWRKKSLKK